MFTDEYRVAICVNKKRGSCYNSYILKLYDDKVKLFTANGRIALNYSFVIKDICKVDFQPTKKQSDGSKKGVLEVLPPSFQTLDPPLGTTTVKQLNKLVN